MPPRRRADNPVNHWPSGRHVTTAGSADHETRQPVPEGHGSTVAAGSSGAATFAVVIALAAAVPLLYLPLNSLLQGEDGGDPGTRPTSAVVGLAGLVVIFCLYTALKQRELDAMRRRLEQQEREKADVRTRLSELSACSSSRPP